MESCPGRSECRGRRNERNTVTMSPEGFGRRGDRRKPRRNLGRSTIAAVGIASVLGGAAFIQAPLANAATGRAIDNQSPSSGAGAADWGARAGMNFTGAWNGSGSSGSVTNVYLGSYFVGGQGGIRGFCIQYGVNSTSVATTPSVLGGDAAAEVNYIISNFAGSPANDAAVAYAVHTLIPEGFQNDSDPVLSFWKKSDDFAAYRAQAEAWIAEARANAGPYTVQPALSIAPDMRTGTVKGSLTSKSGSAVAGKTATFTIEGPAAFSNGSRTITADANSTVNFTALGNGVVSVTERVDGLTGSTLTQYSGAGTQTKVVSGSTTAAEGRSADAEVRVDFQPAANSTAVSTVKAGEKLTDTLHVFVKDGQPNDWGYLDAVIEAIFTVDWYYSESEQAPNQKSIPANAVLFDSVKVTASGVGDVLATSNKVAESAGGYYPVVSFKKADQPAGLRQYFKADWTALFNAQDESNKEETVQQYIPEVQTKTSKIVDGKISDELDLSKNDPATELTINSELILTDASPVADGVDIRPTNAESIGTVQTKITGNGKAVTPSLDVPWSKIIKMWESGKTPTLYWSETIEATKWTQAWSGKHLLPNESTILDKPVIVTKASPNGVVPLEMNDTGVLTGTVPNGPGVKVETKVDQYKFDNSTDGSAQPVCQNPFYTSPWQTVTAPGDITYPKHTTEYPGTYGYSETLKVTVTDEGQPPVESILHRGKCGAKDETVIAFPKNVTVNPDNPEKPVLQVPGGINGGNIAPVSAGGIDFTPIAAGSVLALLTIAGTGIWLKRRRATASTDTQE